MRAQYAIEMGGECECIRPCEEKAGTFLTTHFCTGVTSQGGRPLACLHVTCKFTLADGAEILPNLVGRLRLSARKSATARTWCLLTVRVYE